MPRPERSSSFDEVTINKLEKQLTQRPEKSELVDRNILKGRTPIRHLACAR